MSHRHQKKRTGFNYKGHQACLCEFCKGIYYGHHLCCDDEGDTGPQGAQGVPGQQGPQGAQGPPGGGTGATGIAVICACVGSPVEAAFSNTFVEPSNNITYNQIGDCFTISGRFQPNNQQVSMYINNTISYFEIPLTSFGLSQNFSINTNCTSGTWVMCADRPSSAVTGSGESQSGGMYLQVVGTNMRFIIRNNFDPTIQSMDIIHFNINGRVT